MTDTMIFLSVALVAAGLYIMHLHSTIARYRAWSRQAAALLMQVTLAPRSDEDEEDSYWRKVKAEREYGFDVYPKEEDE